MSEMIERVARALKDNLARQFDAKPLHGDAASGDWHATGGTIELEEMARVAIEAMREPTVPMVKRGVEAQEMPGRTVECVAIVLSAYTVMIDEALKP